MATHDVIIIGGGIIGCATAYYLACRGVKATVLEAGDIACGGSGGCVGGVRQTGRDPKERPLSMYSVGSLWPGLSEALGVDTEYFQSGNMKLAKTEEQEQVILDTIENDTSAGLDIRVLYGDDIFALNPHATRETVCASWCPTDGHANPLTTTLGYYVRAQDKGARFLRGQRVVRLEKRPGATLQVVTQDNVYQAEQVLLCAGFHSRAIARTVGIDIPMLPLWSQTCVSEPLPRKFDMYLQAADWSFYCQQHRNGTFIFGADGPYDLYDALYDRPETFSFVAPYFARAFQNYLPGIKGFKIIRTWSGMLDMCWDGIPVISPVEEVPGLILACAFTGHGFAIAPGAGHVLSQLLLGESPAVDISGLRYDRFRGPGTDRGDSRL